MTIELNKIYCEDNLQTMARMPDEFIDLTVTSPPYDNLRTYNGFSWNFERVAQELFRVTKKGGVVVWVVGDATINGSETGTSFRQALGFMAAGFHLHDTMIYQRDGCRFPETNRYYPIWEFMFVCSKGKPTTTNLIQDRLNIHSGDSLNSCTQRERNGSLVSVSAARIARDRVIKDYGVRFNVWTYPAGNGKSTQDDVFSHPATYPEALAKDHILSWSNPGDLVYDPFMGSGTTAKAAHQLGRKWIGSEISQEYVDLANKRLEPYLAQESLFA